MQWLQNQNMCSANNFKKNMKNTRGPFLHAQCSDICLNLKCNSQARKRSCSLVRRVQGKSTMQLQGRKLPSVKFSVEFQPTQSANRTAWSVLKLREGLGWFATLCRNNSPGKSRVLKELETKKFDSIGFCAETEIPCPVQSSRWCGRH